MDFEKIYKKKIEKDLYKNLKIFLFLHHAFDFRKKKNTRVIKTIFLF